MNTIAAAYVALPWTWMGPTPRTNDDGTQFFEIAIEELPEFHVYEATADDAVAAAGEALEVYIDSFLSAGEKLPRLPKLSEGKLIRPFEMVMAQA